jgi:signal transduction histidine kinase
MVLIHNEVKLQHLTHRWLKSGADQEKTMSTFMPKTLKQLAPRAILTGTFIVFFCPFLMVVIFPAQLDKVMEKSSYLVFHNVAEFFSIMVSLCVFSVGWYTYDQSKDQRSLFLGTAFLVVGLLDFMHTLSNAAMPAFITPNSTNKSTQFWIAARLLDASAFLASAFVYPEKQNRGVSKTTMMTGAVALTLLIFTAITFFPAYLPATAIQGIGLTPFKRLLEFVVIILLASSWVVYWKRMAKTGDSNLVYFLAALIICIFSEAVFASYKTGFDTYNVLGHIYKVVAFYLIYKGIFTSAVRKPYMHLSEANEKLLRVNRLFTVLSETNKAIVHAVDRDSLFRDICRVAVVHGGFQMAWIGIVDEVSGMVKPVAWSGKNEGYLDEIRVSTREEPEGLGPTGRAIREEGLKVCSDILNEPCAAPWRREAEKRGYRSSAAIPLKMSEKAIGALTIYADETDFFRWQLTDMLSQMAEDISFALDNLELEARRRETERALQEETLERLRVMESLHEKDQMLIHQSRLAAMGEMINNIAHQWRQPLNVVGLIVQEVQMMYDLGDFSKEYLDKRVAKVKEVLFHMSHTINDFRNFFQPDKEKESFQVSRIVTRTLSLIEESLISQQIRVEVKMTDDPEIHGYPNQYSQVLLNILINARDAFSEHITGDARLINITASTESDKAVVTITDNAGGIPEEIIHQIFDAYFTTKGPAKGTGVGLYMSKAIIDQNMNGRLTVRNTGDGAEFTIEIPNHGAERSSYLAS